MINDCLYQSFGHNILFPSTYNNNNSSSNINNNSTSNTTIGHHNLPNIESICFDIKMYPANHSETPSQSGQSQFKSIPVTDHCDISHLQPYSWDMLDYSSQVVEPRRRELRAVPTVSEIDNNDNGVDSYFNVSMNQDHHIHRVHDGTSSSGGNGDNFNNSNNIIVKKRKITGHRRIGDRPYPKRMMSASDKCTLEVRKIPVQLNNMKNLLSHFQKFGNIVNLQVSPDNDPEAALVTFEHPSEAMNAYRSTEAVLNNRFIRVFWHNRDHQHQSYSNQSKQSQHHHQPQHSLLSVVGNFGSGSQQKSDDYSGSDVRRTRSSATNNNNHHGERVPRVSVKDRLGSRIGKPVVRVPKYSPPENVSNVGEAEGSESTSSAMNDVSSSTKPQPVVPSQSGSQPSTEDTSENTVPNEPENDLNKEKLHKKLELQKKRQAILYKVVELQKKRQEILLSYMRQQKILVEKLGKAKNDKEKSEIKATVDTLSEQIKGLEDEIRKEAQTILTESAKLSTSDKKNKLQVEKELLDAELDFYNKLQKGETSAELSRKLHELKLKANYLGVSNSRSPRFLKRFANMRGALQNRKARANHVLGRNTFDKFRKVDRRTRKVLVEDIGEEDNMDLLSHISQYAEVETIDHSPQGSIVTFKTRQDAEVGMRQISSVKFREHQGLKCSWFEGSNKSKLEGSESEAADSISKLNDENSLDEKIEKEEHEEENQEGNEEKPGTNLHEDDLLLGLNVNDLLDEEESEDEDESRAWRR